MQRSRLPYVFLGLALILAASSLTLLLMRMGVNDVPPPRVLPGPATPPSGDGKSPSDEQPTESLPTEEKPTPSDDPETVLKDLGVGLTTSDPADLVNRIAKALEEGDMNNVGKLIGKQAMDEQTAARLKALAASPMHIRQPGGIREIGEIELNKRTRWAIELEGAEPGRDQIIIDLQRVDQKWSVEKITLPTAAGEPIPKAALADPLAVADAFLRAVIRQDFEFARNFVNPSTVSDTKIAGLCILFEEGQYQMRKAKPLRAMFQHDDLAGYIANVESSDGKEQARFSLTLQQPPAPANWRVSEINLDDLLADYARRVAGGDIYYSPLVKNPAGGDTLALYFDFDEDSMSPRTRRQLEIVSLILKADPGKKITISGHTDALGTDPYNNSLSSRRASSVRDFLIQAGVTKSQIVTIAKGASQPRRPNVTESGEDDPAGRRANRRTEIYLDF